MGDNVIYNNWLSEIVDQDCYDVVVSEGFILENTSKRESEKTQWINSLKNNNRRLFLQAKVSTQAVKQIIFLEQNGFYLIDTNVLLRKEIRSKKEISTKELTGRNITIRFAESKDREGTVQVGQNSFIYSRFHLDPWFSKELADKVKASWVDGYFRGNRGEQMVITLIGNKIVGFLQVLMPADDHFIIDLIGIDKDHRRKGIAENMIRFAILQNSPEHVLVGTQIGNIPSIKLYQKMGFFLDGAKYVFHFHRNQTKDII